MSPIPAPSGAGGIRGSRTFLGLGSNLGDRRRWLEEAVRRLAALPGLQILRTSSLYETEPWGGVPQPRYLNLVAEGWSAIPPEALLEAALAVEQELGRVRSVRWGPRTVDVDLLWVEGEERSTERLTLPHPRLTQRAFVLVPLAELEPDLVVDGRKVRWWLEQLRAGEGDVVRVDGPLIDGPLPAGAGSSGLDEAVDVEHEDGSSA